MRILPLLFLMLSVYPLYASDKAGIDSLHQQAYRLLDSNPDSAFVLATIAEAKAFSRGLKFEEGNSLFIQAYIYSQKEELGKAFVLYLRALEILRPLKAEKALLAYTKILLNTGIILKQHYAYPQAIQYYDEGIGIAWKQKFNERLLKLYFNKAEALRQIEEFDQALGTIKSALDLAQREKDEDMILSSLNQRGLILKDMGRYEEARASYRRIIGFEFDKLSPEEYRGRSWHNIAVTYVEEKRHQEAAEAYHKALNEKIIGDEKRLYITWLDLGEVYYLLGDYKKAYEMEQKALALYDEMLLLPDHYALFSLLSKTTYKLGEHEQSHAYSERFIAVNKRFLQAQKEILQVKDQYKMEILTAGFFLELEASKTKEQYQTMLIILICSVVFFVSLFGYEKVRQYKVRHNIRSTILDIERKSNV